MKRRFFRYLAAACLALACIALLGGPLKAEDKVDGPTIITSERLYADNKARFALFEGSVIARNDTITLHADSMKVYYREDGEVDRIIAEGKVKLVREAGVITSGHAEYLAEGKKIIFTSGPRAVEGRNVVTGSKMTYLIDEERSIVENSRVFLEDGK